MENGHFSVSRVTNSHINNNYLQLPGAGGEGVLNKVLYGEAQLRGPTPFLFHTIV